MGYEYVSSVLIRSSERALMETPGEMEHRAVGIGSHESRHCTETDVCASVDDHHELQVQMGSGREGVICTIDDRQDHGGLTSGRHGPVVEMRHSRHSGVTERYGYSQGESFRGG